MENLTLAARRQASIRPQSICEDDGWRLQARVKATALLAQSKFGDETLVSFGVFLAHVDKVTATLADKLQQATA